MVKGDFVKIGVGEYNKCTPFNSPKFIKYVLTTVISVYAFSKKRNGPAFTCKVGKVLKTVGIGRTDFYKIITQDEYVLLKMEQ